MGTRGGETRHRETKSDTTAPSRTVRPAPYTIQRGGGVGALEASTEQEAGILVSRAAPIPGAMAGQGTREAMADPGTQEAMVEQGARAAMADPPPRPRPQPQKGACEERPQEGAVLEQAQEGAVLEQAQEGTRSSSWPPTAAGLGESRAALG